jgi:hypothetical protein
VSTEKTCVCQENLCLSRINTLLDFLLTHFLGLLACTTVSVNKQGRLANQSPLIHSPQHMWRMRRACATGRHFDLFAVPFLKNVLPISARKCPRPPRTPGSRRPPPRTCPSRPPSRPPRPPSRPPRPPRLRSARSRLRAPPARSARRTRR